MILQNESDAEVKKNALEGLAAIVRINSKIVKVEDILKFAFAEIAVRKELIEEVKLPDDSTQKLDHGIKIRKASYNLLVTLFESGAANSEFTSMIVESVTTTGLADTSNEIIIVALNLLTIFAKKAFV